MDILKLIFSQDLPHLGALIVILALGVALVVAATSAIVKIKSLRHLERDDDNPSSSQPAFVDFNTGDFVTTGEFKRSVEQILAAVAEVQRIVTAHAHQMGELSGRLSAVQGNVADLKEDMDKIKSRAAALAAGKKE